MLTLSTEDRYLVGITAHLIHNRKLINSNSTIFFLFAVPLIFDISTDYNVCMFTGFKTFHCNSFTQQKSQTMNRTGCFHFCSLPEEEEEKKKKKQNSVK